MEFKEKFIAFVDILGFKGLVDAAEKGTGKSLPELMEVLMHLGSSEDVELLKKHGPTLCPLSPYNDPSLDFQVMQISDCVIVSAEISPVGALSIIRHCSGSVMQLMRAGFMCRGYITKGLVFHTESQVIGSGYQNAYAQESQVSAFQREANERGTPFVEVDPVVCEYIADSNDECVNKMFSRMVKSDGDVTAIYPFQRIGHSFILMGENSNFIPEREKAAVQNVREGIYWIKDNLMKHVDVNNKGAISKVEHYIHALDAQLEACDKTDHIIEMFS